MRFRRTSRKLAAVRKALGLLDGAMRSCRICPRKCAVDRTNGEKGFCRAPLKPVVYSYLAHHGEEPPLSGENGSGTIFFSHCNMRCVYCQNFSFSQLDEGDETEAAGLADMMLKLEGSGCHNINLVSPTHYVPQILEALEVALAAGLSVPVVYNTGGYELTETLKCLNGVIDIYMPDMRYSSDRMAALYSGATDYVANNRSAVMEMHHQVGDLVLDDEGIAKKGLIIRLLVLPNGISGTIDTLRFIKDNVSEKAYLSVMSQYHPTYRAADFEPISRRITPSEYKNVVDAIAELGLNNGWIQESPDGIDLRFLGNNIRPDRRQMP